VLCAYVHEDVLSAVVCVRVPETSTSHSIRNMQCTCSMHRYLQVRFKTYSNKGVDLTGLLGGGSWGT